MGFIAHLSGLPGAFGLLTVFPALLYKLSHFGGSIATLIGWIFCMLAAMVTTWSVVRFRSDRLRYVTMSIDIVWLVIGIFPGGIVVWIALMEYFQFSFAK